MWKTLSIIAGLTLLAAAGITFTQIKPALSAERTQASNAAEFQQKARDNLAAARQAETEREALVQSTKDELTAAERDKAAAAAKKDELIREFETQNTTKETASREMEELEAQLNELGGLSRLVQELKAEQGRRAEYESQIAGKKAAIASAQATAAAAATRTAELQRIIQHQQSGTMEPGFSSRVTSVTPEWGFFRIAAGNNRRVVHQATLDVVRDGVVVGRGVVTDVSPSTASADIIPGSVAPGDSILPGDTVVISQASKLSAPTPGAAPAATPAPAAPGDAAAPATDGTAEEVPADPFATPGAPSDPAPAADPFAPSAPATEPIDTSEPVEPAAGADPFPN